jgi:hypothetical protein
MSGLRSIGKRTIIGWSGRILYSPSTWSQNLVMAFRLVRLCAFLMSLCRRRTAFLGWSESYSLVTWSMSILEYQTLRNRIEANRSILVR